MIDAVTLDDARRVAKRLLDGGLLVTVVGRPDGPRLDGRRIERAACSRPLAGGRRAAAGASGELR